jgi:hypothetical protein
MLGSTHVWIQVRGVAGCPRRGGSAGPNGGRCGRAAGADISTGVQCPERGGDFPPWLWGIMENRSMRGTGHKPDCVIGDSVPVR